MSKKSVSVNDVRRQSRSITCLTCYDYLTARVMDQVSELDIILVGDSLGMVVQGNNSTLSVTVEDMVYHTRCVGRGVDRALLVSDIPFLEMARSRDHLVETVQSIIQEGGAQAVKIEGGERNGDSIRHLVDHDVPVMGHLGLTPQSIESFGGYRPRGRTKNEIQKLGRDARVLEEAGVFAVVLECLPAPLARELTDMISVPTIGIGAGSGCDGQVLVWQDLMGLTEGTPPSFVRTWENLTEELKNSIGQFCGAVRNQEFPSDEESYSLPEEIESQDWKQWLKPS